MAEPTVTIRPWQPSDASQLVPMIQACLEDTAAVGADWAPTPHNVDLMLKLGLMWAERGDPSLVLESQGEILAYTLWGELPSELDTMHRSCAALGTYVVERVRRLGIAQALRNEAIARAKRAGYDRILGSTYDPGGHASAERVGFRVVGNLVERKLQ